MWKASKGRDTMVGNFWYKVFVLVSTFNYFSSVIGALLRHTVDDERKHGSGLYGQQQLSHTKLIDGDMLMLLRRRGHQNRERRLVIDDDGYNWIGASVPYVFDQRHPIDKVMYNLTLDAFAEISKHSCIKFVPRTDEEDYVNITAVDTGCYSQVGRFGEGEQPLNLASDCDSLEVIVHELMHTLGFLHEHNRLDRDQYVYVNYTNVMINGQSSFQKYNPQVYGPYTIQGIPYDKQSVLHYHRYAFSVHGLKSHLEKKEDMVIYSLSDYTETLGNRQGLSEKDIFRLNIRYCDVEEYKPPTTAPTKTTSKGINNNNPTAIDEVTESINIVPTTNSRFNVLRWGLAGVTHNNTAIAYTTSVYATIPLATMATIMLGMMF